MGGGKIWSLLFDVCCPVARAALLLHLLPCLSGPCLCPCLCLCLCLCFCLCFCLCPLPLPCALSTACVCAPPPPTVSPSVRPLVGAAIGAALGAAVVYAGYQAKQKRDGAAVIDLYNYLVEVREGREGVGGWVGLKVFPALFLVSVYVRVLWLYLSVQLGVQVSGCRGTWQGLC